MRRAVAVGLVLSACACACAPAAPGILLTTESASAPADGITKVRIVAAVEPKDVAAVVTFSVSGIGMLSSTTAVAVDGVATVDLWAPFENQLEFKAGVTTLVSAAMTIDDVAFTHETAVEFTFPADGPADLRLSTDRDHVVAGSGEQVVLSIDGLRLTDATVSITSDSVDLPSTLALTPDPSGVPLFHGELTITAPESPTVMNVTVAAPGLDPVVAELVFVGDGEPQFDLNGTFAQVSYSKVSINVIGLDPGTQTVVAPTYSLVHVTHDGAHLLLETTTCVVEMPSVRITGIGCSTTTVGGGFVAASNLNSVPLEFDLTDVSQGAAFSVPAAALAEPFVMGAAGLTDKINEPLPTSDEDEAESDDDGDGNPGVTITNSVQGPQHIASRSFTREMTGTIIDSNAIDGSAMGETTTVIFNQGLINIEPRITAFPSPFHLRRVDGGGTDISDRDSNPALSCADLETYIGELTALVPPPPSDTLCEDQ